MTKEQLLEQAKPILFNTDMVRAILDNRKSTTRRIVKFINTKNPTWEDRKLPCQRGDILYIRETWHKYTKRVGKGERCRLQEFNGYKASIANSEDANEKWRPSIHMPKAAARIFLKVTNVRVERLQEMNLDDFLSEGVELRPEAFNAPENAYQQAKKIFQGIWNSTIKKAELNSYSWEANPWVWAIEFERVYPESEE